MQDPKSSIKGRGSVENIKNRFESLEIVFDFSELPPDEFSDELNEELKPGPKTQFFRDSSKSIVASNSSPDIPFEFSLNPYRGCEHGCAYCYARPTHEYLGMSAGLDFETKIFVKENAPELLRAKLMSKAWEPAAITMSGVTDCYQPAERKFQLTRQCLEVLADFKNPATIITKNALVLRDIDIFKKMNEYQGILVCISVTSLDSELCSELEPRTSRPQARIRVIEELSRAGIPVMALLAPMIPGLNDHEMPQILKAISQAGAKHAGYVPLRLPLAVAPLFSQWLELHCPDRKEKVLNHIRDMRGGLLNSAKFGERMSGQGPFAENLRQMFRVYCSRLSLNKNEIHLSTKHFTRPEILKPISPEPQLSFF